MRHLLAIALVCLVSCVRSEVYEPRSGSGSSDASVADGDGFEPDAPFAPDAHFAPDALFVAADASFAPDSSFSPDATSLGPDAGPGPGLDAGGSCTEYVSWRLEPRQIQAVRLTSDVFGLPGPRMGSSDRLLVDVPLRSNCELLARVDVVVSPGDATDFVALAAFAWVEQRTGCDPTPRLSTMPVTVPGAGGGNFNAALRDSNFPTSSWGMTYSRSQCGHCVCSPSLPPGTRQRDEDCSSDCDCAPGLACVAFVGDVWQCQTPCATGIDCLTSGLTCSSDFGNICVSQLGDCRASSCPAGFACQDLSGVWRCVDQRGTLMSATCQCDRDCAAGYLCIQAWGATPTCEVPCASSADCPQPLQLLCSSASVCIWPLD